MSKKAQANQPEGNYTSEDYYFPQELELAFRNRGIPSEGLRLPVTPTGMHYLLNHFDIPVIDSRDWNLKIHGHVKNPISLDLQNIRDRPSVTMPVTMECAGNGRAFMKPRPVNQPWIHGAVSTAKWTGTPLRHVLEEAGIEDGATEVLFTGSDLGVQGGEEQFYQRSLRLDDAMKDEVMLVHEMNGAPLEPQHGYPLRLVVPGWYGMTNVKWLENIEVVTEPFNGMQMQFYRETTGADDQGTAIETMKVRALMAPPGISDFPSLKRTVEKGKVELMGRAWAGRHAIARVEVSTDNGASWSDANLDDSIGDYAWIGWRFDWQATPGQHVLCVRATNSNGDVQPDEHTWSHYGVANNGVARVEVEVR